MSTSNGVIPNGHSRREDGVIFRISGLVVVVVTLSLPLVGFVACIIISMLREFEDSTYATCTDLSKGKVVNFLPSISSAIGSFTPQRYVWRICFSIHLAPRLLFGVMHYQYNMGFPVTKNRSWYRRLNGLACFIHFGELLGLILLTYISSTENYPIHEKGFMLFVLCAEIYMVLVMGIFYWARQEITWTSRDIKSFRLKITFFCLSILCASLALYFFNRHMQHCEPNMYSGFAVFEYLLVISNVGFHATWMVLEFGDSSIKMTGPVRPGQYSSLSV